MLTLSPEDRRICDRRYHGGWSVARLAEAAGIEEPSMRKRLQRIRDRLRKEIEMSEEHVVRSEDVREGLPEKIVELLARPRLTDLPENPVGSVLEQLRSERMRNDSGMGGTPRAGPCSPLCSPSPLERDL